MKKRRKPAKGGSARAVKAREIDFANAYIANGRNGTQAAIEAGFSKKGAHVTATRLLKRANVIAIVDAAAAKAAEESGLTVERTLREVARIAYSSPKRFYRDKVLVRIDELDDEDAACVASFEVDDDKEGNLTKKIKIWDKPAALGLAARILGMFEKDNRQQPAAVALHPIGKVTYRFKPYRGRERATSQSR